MPKLLGSGFAHHSFVIRSGYSIERGDPMKPSRRELFRIGLGAAQLALLSRFGTGTSRAEPTSGGPNKLLTVWLQGGLHWESFFTPLSAAGVTKFIPTPSGGSRPHGYLPIQVENWDRSPVDLNAPGVRRKLRGPIYWNWDNPQARTGTIPASGGTQLYRSDGYVWANPQYKLYERTALLVGADQGTASHYSGVVSSLCGVAGANFRAPAIAAVVANQMYKRLPDRPLANVSLTTMVPHSLNLPTRVAPVLLRSAESVEPTMSDRRDGAWRGLRTRKATDDLSFAGDPLGGTVPTTAIDAFALKETRGLRASSTSGTDALLEQLYDSYRGASKLIARDILSTMMNTVGFEYLNKDSNYPATWTACTGIADQCGGLESMGPYDLALRLLKSDLVTSVMMRASSIRNTSFDTHYANGAADGSNFLRIAMEGLGRLLVEMMLTPSRQTPGKTLLDETMVYVCSDFGRTFPKEGSDHHPATCALLVGGNVIGNQMVGSYNEAMNGSPMGVPVELIEEHGGRATREPRSQDIAATVLRGFALEPGRDYFIPGGYGYFDGVIG